MIENTHKFLDPENRVVIGSDPSKLILSTNPLIVLEGPLDDIRQIAEAKANEIDELLFFLKPELPKGATELKQGRKFVPTKALRPWLKELPNPTLTADRPTKKLSLPQQLDRAKKIAALMFSGNWYFTGHYTKLAAGQPLYKRQPILEFGGTSDYADAPYGYQYSVEGKGQAKQRVLYKTAINAARQSKGISVKDLLKRLEIVLPGEFYEWEVSEDMEQS